MIPRPRMRLPIGVAILVVCGAYLVRSLILRGGDFSLDTPGDIVALTVIVLGIALVAWARREG